LTIEPGFQVISKVSIAFPLAFPGIMYYFLGETIKINSNEKELIMAGKRFCMDMCD
jgi:hypothetical protein